MVARQSYGLEDPWLLLRFVVCKFFHDPEACASWASLMLGAVVRQEMINAFESIMYCITFRKHCHTLQGLLLSTF